MNKEAPAYICWFENDFMADRAVIRMTPHQRLMYRALCQVARYCETRPYLPDDDNELYVLADSDSLDHWKDNREDVLRKFQRVVIDGKPMLAQKRVLAGAEDYEEWLAQKKAAGKSSAKARSQRSLNGRSSGSVESNESNESIENGKSKASTDPSQPQNLLTPTGIDTSLPQNSSPDTQNPSEEIPTAPEGFRHDAPVGLAWEFGEWVKMTSLRRKKLGFPDVPLQRPPHWKTTWAGDFRRLLDAGYTTAEIRMMMKFVFNSDRWIKFMVRPAGFVKCHDQIAGDLRIPIHEVAPEMTPREREIARTRRMHERERDDFREEIRVGQVEAEMSQEFQDQEL